MAYTTAAVMATLATYGPYIAAGAAAAAAAGGAGITAYSQNEQAKTSVRMAQYNAEIQRQDAEIQNRLAQYQYDVNARAAESEAQARINTAIGIQNQATGVESQALEKARRLREENERNQSMIRAKFAKAGVVAEGSPLVVLSDQARLSEMNVQDEMYSADLTRTDLLRKADLARFEAGFSLLGAGQERYKAEASTAGKRIAYRQAELTRLSGRAQAATYRAGAAASLIGGAGNVAGIGYQALT